MGGPLKTFFKKCEQYYLALVKVLGVGTFTHLYIFLGFNFTNWSPKGPRKQALAFGPKRGSWQPIIGVDNL